MQFQIQRDNGETLTVDPMNSGLADKLVNELSPEELAVLGLFVVSLTATYHSVAHKMQEKYRTTKESRMREILKTTFTPEQAEEILRSQPVHPNSYGGAFHDENLTGLYL